MLIFHQEEQIGKAPDPGCLQDAKEFEDLLPALEGLDLAPDDPGNAVAIDPETATLEDLKITLKFIKLIHGATLDNGGLDPNTIDQLRNPIEQPLDVGDPDLLLALRIFLATTSAAHDTYTDVMYAISERFPDSESLSHYQIKQRITQLTGISPLVHDMCINSCAGFTGPFENLMHCPICRQFRYDPIPCNESNGDQKIPCQTFCTFLIGPQLQTLWRNPETAEALHYRVRRTEEISAASQREDGSIDIQVYEDIPCGSEYIEAFLAGCIGEHDTTLLLSLNGTQLYRKKVSDCWIYIWLIFDFSPELQYKKHVVFFGSIIPGPLKSKHFDSLLYPGFHHLSALQCDGFRV